MGKWWKSVVGLVLAWTSANPVWAQNPPSPLMFPPSAPPQYFSGPGMGFPPGGGHPSQGFPPGYPTVPRGYPIPGRDDPQAFINKQGDQTNPLIMSSEGSNAFSEERCCNEDEGGYLTIGAMGLARTSLSSRLIAVRDPRGVRDRFLLPPPGSPDVLNANDIDPEFNWGIRGAIGYRYGVSAVEIFGWQLFAADSVAIAADQGRLALPFAPFPIPNGLGIDNSVWLNADQVTLTHRTKVGNVEGNYRFGVGMGSEIIFGIRYMNVWEQFDIRTDDNGLTVDPIDPRTIVTYRTQTNSNILGPQVGWELETCFSPWLNAGLFTKLFAGVNYYDVDLKLFREDGFVAIENQRSNTTVSGAWELGGYFDFLLLARMRFRMGYQMMLVVNVPEAHDQIDFNIQANPFGSGRDHGNILYHGPIFEFHFAF
jgi:hypothetical protein